MGLIINTIYKSELKARLIAPNFQLPFKNIEEFAGSDLLLGVPKGGNLESAIMVNHMKENYIFETFKISLFFLLKMISKLLVLSYLFCNNLYYID